MTRTLVPMLASIAMLIAGTATAEPSGDPFDDKRHPVPPGQTMSSEEVTAYALPYLPRVSRCYKDHALGDRRPTGQLELYLVIARTGRVVHADVTAPGVLRVRKARLDRCLRDEVRRWRFPARTGFTNATIPYFLLHTRAPANGPQPNA